MKANISRFVLLSTGILFLFGCSRPTPLTETRSTTPIEVVPADVSRLVGTVWTGTFDHENAEGCRTDFTWHFLADGKLRDVRYDGSEKTFEWKVEDGWVIVNSPWHGYVDLQRTGDTMTGGARFRGGYGTRWEYELRRKK